MSKALSLALYNLLLPFGLLAMAPGAIVKMRRRGGRWRDFGERLGRFDPARLAEFNALPSRGGRFWVHAVSVGEVNVAKKLIARLLDVRAESGIILTSTTPTGHQLAREFAQKHPGRVVAAYSPLDLPFVATRALDAFAPGQLVLVEAEVWPNIVNAAKARGIPVSLVNARLSQRSERRFRMLGGLVRPVFAMLDQVLVQEPSDRDRWAYLGVPSGRIHLTGSIKFDPEGATVSDRRLDHFRSILQGAGWTEQTPTVIAASTHPGEELRIAELCEHLRARIPELMLLIVPRHIERTTDIIQELRGIDLRPVRRTELERSPVKTNIVLIDTTGELRAWQFIASVVIIGKSFLAEGGQNPAEALMARKPVVFGPHMENFQALTNLLLDKNGAVQASDLADLERAVHHLLTDTAEAARIAAAGHESLRAHEGATARSVERLLALE